MKEDDASRRIWRDVAGLAHELKGPLVAIDQWLMAARDLEEDGELEGGDLALILEHVRVSVAHQSSLVERMVETASAKASPIAPRTERFDLATLLEDFRPTGEVLCKAYGNAFSAQVAGAGGAVDSDRVGLWQIIHNLVANAARFTSGGAVELAAHIEGPRVLVEVRDTGHGMTPEQAAEAFEPFVRSGVDGRTGLGLWIVRELAGALGGAVSLQTAPGEGSTFTVEIARDLAEVTGAPS